MDSLNTPERPIDSLTLMILEGIDANKVARKHIDLKAVLTVRQEGWICPKCGKVYSPSVDNCSSCNGGKASQYDREKAQKRLHDLGINMDKVCRIRLYIPDIDSVKIEDEYWLFKRDGAEFKLNFSDMSVLQYVKGEYIITDLSKTLKELIKGHLIY